MDVVIILIIALVLIILINLNNFVKKNLRNSKSDIEEIKESLYLINQRIRGLEVSENKDFEKEKETKSDKKEKTSSYQSVKIKTEEKLIREEVPKKEEQLEKEEVPEENLEKLRNLYGQKEENSELLDKIHKINEEKSEKEELLEKTEVFEKPEEKLEEKQEQPLVVEAPISKQATEKSRQIVEASQKNKEKKAIKKSSDLEKFIGENLINKIGIVILVLGLGFLVKYAIDKNWINEVGRVAIGILSATALIGLAHKLRKDYKSFSSVLIGGGLALLYFTISLAFHTEGYPLYQKQAISFIILIFITIFAVFLSISYNRVEIAILAILGGFGSPIMISTGSGNYIILMSYITVLNLGMLSLSYFKKWRLVNIVSFLSTVLLFSSWLVASIFNEKIGTFNGAIFFATVFYVIFFLMNIVFNIKYKINFKALDIILLISNTATYFAFVMIMLHYLDADIYKGLFTILLAVFNFVFAFYIFKRTDTDKNLLYLLIGLVFTFITLAIPLQLKGNYITLFWSAEAVLLLWLSHKSDFKILKNSSVIVLFLMIIGLLMDWEKSAYLSISNSLYEESVIEYAIIFNKIFLTSLFSIASLLAISFLLKKEKEGFWFIPLHVQKTFIAVLTLIIIYLSGFLEVNYHASNYFYGSSSQRVVLLAYNSIYLLSLIIFALKQKKRIVSVIIGYITVFYVLFFLISLSTVFSKSVYYIIENKETYPATLLIFRWLSIISVYVISVLLYKLVTKITSKKEGSLVNASLVFMIFTFLYLISADLDMIAVLIAKNKSVLAYTQKTGYAIIWGLSSFLLMIIGMKRKLKVVRILSLVIFTVTLIKLFVYDISNISEAGKIIAFILLGILLLIISFMYQKVKKLVIDDDFVEEEKKEEIEI